MEWEPVVAMNQALDCRCPRWKNQEDSEMHHACVESRIGVQCHSGHRSDSCWTCFRRVRNEILFGMKLELSMQLHALDLVVLEFLTMR